MVDHCDNSVFNNNLEDRSNCEASGVTPGENIYVNADTVLQLGGRATTPTYPANVMTERFDGCMKNLMHNAEVRDSKLSALCSCSLAYVLIGSQGDK